MNKLTGIRRSAAIGSAAALGALAAAQPTPAATPRACGVFTKALASTLIKEPPKAIVDGPLVCTYGRSSERAATMSTTLSFTIVQNPSVAAARAVQHRLELFAPRKAAGGDDGVRRAVA